MFEMLRALLRNLGTGPATRRYPAVAREMYPSSRGRVESVIENCIFCGVCQRRCPADCIVVDRQEKTWNLDPYQCIVCGVCVEVCPTKAIAMRPEFRKPRSERVPLTHRQAREAGGQPAEGPVEG